MGVLWGRPLSNAACELTTRGAPTISSVSNATALWSPAIYLAWNPLPLLSSLIPTNLPRLQALCQEVFFNPILDWAPVHHFLQPLCIPSVTFPPMLYSFLSTLHLSALMLQDQGGFSKAQSPSWKTPLCPL